MSTPSEPGRRLRGRYILSNWLWAALFAALVGIVVWGWAFDFHS